MAPKGHNTTRVPYLGTKHRLLLRRLGVTQDETNADGLSALVVLESLLQLGAREVPARDKAFEAPEHMVEVLVTRTVAVDDYCYEEHQRDRRASPHLFCVCLAVNVFLKGGGREILGTEHGAWGLGLVRAGGTDVFGHK